MKKETRGRPREHKKPVEKSFVRFSYASDLEWVQSVLEAKKEGDPKRNIAHVIDALETVKKKHEKGEALKLA